MTKGTAKPAARAKRGGNRTGSRIDKARKGPAIITIDRVRCKGCGICVEFCPQDVLQMAGQYPEVVAAECCTQCQLCDFLCPDFAIIVREGK